MQKDLISIIVPVYNVEKYLSKCLDSIINQTYKNIEIILIDDGSTDNSGAICDEYKLKDNRIKVIHQNNKGVSFARRVGYISSNGEIISFIDGDDYISKRMIEIMHKVMCNKNVDIVMCKDVSVNVTNGKQSIRKWPQKNSILNRTEALKYIAEDKLKSFFCNKIFKKNIIKKSDFLLDKRFEDFLCMPQIFNRISKVAIIIDPLYFYVRHEESFTSSSISLFNFFKACLERDIWYSKNFHKLYNISINRTLDVAIECHKYKMNDKDKEIVEKFLKENINFYRWLFKLKFREKLKFLRHLHWRYNNV